jgi:hypothetical protein
MNKGMIFLLVIVFVALFTSPWWLNYAGAEKTPPPDLTYPDAVYGTECVMDIDYMTANHMDLLNEWRDKVVRGDERFFEFQGKKWEMSLTNTCMKCHDNKAEFCDRCHDYVDVKPYCWDCHVTPDEGTVIDIEPADCCDKKKYEYSHAHKKGDCCDGKLEDCCKDGKIICVCGKGDKCCKLIGDGKKCYCEADCICKKNAECMKKCAGSKDADCMEKCKDKAKADCKKECDKASKNTKEVK